MTITEQIDGMHDLLKGLLKKAKVRDELAIQEIWGWQFENFRGESYESQEWLECNFPDRSETDALDWAVLTAITHISQKETPRWRRRSAMLLIKAAHCNNWPMHHSVKAEIMELPEIIEQVKHQSKYLGNA